MKKISTTFWATIALIGVLFLSSCVVYGPPPPHRHRHGRVVHHRGPVVRHAPPGHHKHKYNKGPKHHKGPRQHHRR